MKKARVSKSSAPPGKSSEPLWWLAPGSATCDFCLRTYHFEAGYYCAICDRPVCPLCVMEIHDTRIIHCPACHMEDN